MDVVYKSERQNHLKAAGIKMKDDPKFVVKATIEPDPDNDWCKCYSCFDRLWNRI